MGRYSQNIRPIYDDDELTGGEQLSRGVSGAIDSLLKSREERREFENQARMADPNAKFESDPTMWSKFMGRFGRTATGRRPQGAQAPPPPSGAELPTFGVDRQGQPMARPGQPSIGDAIQRTMIEGPGGRRAFLDPYAKQRAQLGMELAGKEREAQIKAKYDPPLTFEQRMAIQKARPTSGSSMTQEQRVELENLRQKGRIAIQSIVSGRGNSAMQLQAAKAVQSSLDGQVRTLQNELAAARRSYDDARVQDLLVDLEEARNAAEEHRVALAEVTGSGGMSPGVHGPENPTAADARRRRQRQAPPAPRRPPKATGLVPKPGTKRVVPPPVKP